jgi:Protein of unknown function (DUF1416)
MSSSCVDAPADYQGETGIHGTVLRGESPVEGAYVRLTGTGDEFVAELPSKADGSFQFYVAEGDWQVICLAPDAPRLVQPVKLNKGAQAEVTFQLAG